MLAERKKFSNEQEIKHREMLEEFEVYKKTLDEEDALEKVELEYAKCLRVG